MPRRSPSVPEAAPAPRPAPAPRTRRPTRRKTEDIDEESGTIGGENVVRKPSIGRRGIKFTTWFQAAGTIGSLRTMLGVEPGKSPDLINEDLEDYAAPAAFYSNQSGLLGRVKWEGIKPLGEIIRELNLKLQFRGEETRDFDFRRVYNEWSYRYQIIETLGLRDNILLAVDDREPKGRRHR